MMAGGWTPASEPLSLPSTFSQSLYDVLMHQRNRAWRERCWRCRRGVRGRRGALHLYGEGNLPSLLRKKMANIIGPSKRNFIFILYRSSCFG
jgi:uncharacterized protein YbaP (TraB family)